MITTYKPKTYDAGQDVSGLKDQLGSVLKEIAAFGSRLEESKALQLHADDYGFAKSFSYEERLRDLKTKLQPGREPAKPVIFLTRMVVESLSRGPMSEKDIKTIVLERCKEVGIKSSNRGLIAGTGMDVATVCSVLAALGAIEAAAPPDSKAEPDLSLLASTAHPLLNTTTSTVNTSPDTITGPGSVLYGVLSERWQGRLTEYIDDALKSKAAALLNEATNGAADGSGVASAVKTEGGATNTVNTIAPGVNPNRTLPVSSASSATATGVSTIPNVSAHAAKSVAPSVPLYNPLGSGHSSVATSAGITPSTSCNNIAGAYLTSTLPSPNSTTHNSCVVASPVPNSTSISNTARLIAEYNSRNGIDPGTASNGTFPASNSAVSTAPNPAQLSYTAPLSAPIAGAPMNTAKPVVNYSLPVTNNAGSTVVAGSVTSVPSVGIPGSAPVMNSATNGPGLSSVNTIGYRAPLGPDATTTNAVYNPLPNSTYPVLHGTTTSIPPSYSSTPYVNTTNINTSVGIPSNTMNSSVKPYTVPHSNPATTPATVGFLSVTNPTNKLVLPYMNGDGTLSKSASSNSISNGMVGVGTTVPSLNTGVGGLNYGLNTNVNTSLNTSLNTSTNSSYIPNTTAYSNLSTVSTSNIGSIGSNAPLGYQPPGPSYPTTTPMMGYNNNTTMPLNSAPYNNNTMYPMNTANYGASFVTNTTNPALYQPVTATNYVNNTNTNSTNANTKTKVKTPKPPAEKKLTKKAAAAASKLDSTNIARVSGAQGMNAVGGSASSSVNGTVTSGTGVNSNKARRGPSALRVWKLREEYVQLDITVPSLITDSKNSIASSSVAKTTNAALALLLDPSLLGTAASMHYAMHSALETEERLLRRIAGLCNINLKPNRYRLGTAMLSSDPDIMNRTSTTSSRLYGTTPSTYTTNSSNAVSTSKVSTKYTDTSSTEDFYTEPTYAVYDDTTPITATYLLDKIRRTKRQRGEVLYGNISLPYTATTASVSAARNAAAASVGVYSAPHVHALAAVVSKTADYFWANTSNGKNKSKKTVATVANPNKAEPITMAQYARNVHTGVGGNNIVLSSCSNGASITNHTLRRYAQPIELYNAHLPCDVSKINAFAAATGGHHNTTHSTSATASNNGTTVLSIPDLTLNTREVAWTSIAAEFAILPAPTEEGSIGFGYSASTAAIDTVSGYVDTSATVGNSSVKKRKYLNNDSVKPSKAGSAESATSATSKSNTNTSSAESNNTTASTLAMEVLAPHFTEIVPVTVVVEQMKAQQQTVSSEGSDGEDTSDEACLARHEAVLQGMRDKWSRLQQLKNDALFGPGGAPPETKAYRGGGGYGGYFNRAATAPASGATTAGVNSAELSPLGSPVGFNLNAKFQNLSPRKRGLASAHAKRRGRPPKNVKHSHVSHSNLVSVGSVGSTGVGKENVTGGDVSMSDDTMEVDELVE